MHEYHLARSLLKSILAKASNLKGIDRIISVNLTLGKLNMVTPQTLQETFSEIASSTLCADTKLIIRETSGSDLVVEDIEAEFKN